MIRDGILAVSASPRRVCLFWSVGSRLSGSCDRKENVEEGTHDFCRQIKLKIYDTDASSMLSAQGTQWIQVSSFGTSLSPPISSKRIVYASPVASYAKSINADIPCLHSRVALKKYIQANNKGVGSGPTFDSQFNRAVKAGVEQGIFAQPKGMSTKHLSQHKDICHPSAVPKHSYFFAILEFLRLPPLSML